MAALASRADVIDEGRTDSGSALAFGFLQYEIESSPRKNKVPQFKTTHGWNPRNCAVDYVIVSNFSPFQKTSITQHAMVWFDLGGR
jgi:hypothetical protein